MGVHVAVLIPCRNEADALGGLLPAIFRHVDKILVVDDGSTDGTANVARAAGAECHRWHIGRGKGAALRTGFDMLAANGFTHALTMDGDGQHDPVDIPAFLGREADLVVGSRNFGDMPLPRRQVNRLMTACLSFYTRRKFPDSQCGFRLVNLEPAREIAWRTRHFEFESEMLVVFSRMGCRIEFVPVRTIYRRERSKIRPLVDALRWLWWWRFAFDRNAVPSYNTTEFEVCLPPQNAKG